MHPLRLLIPALGVVLATVATIRVSRSDDVAPTRVPVPARLSGPGVPTPPVVPAEPTPASPVAVAPGTPEIAFDRTEHDFGTARSQESKTTRFTVRNAGGAALHVSAHGSCGCTSVSIAADDSTSGDGGASTREIAPGERAAIWVTFGTSHATGVVTKSVYVTSDDPKSPTTVLTLKVDVSAGITLAPQGFTFGTVLVGSHPESTIEAKWKDGFGRPFKITSIDAGDMQPSAARPDFRVQAFDAPPWHGYRLTMSFPVPPTVGPVTGIAVVHTDDPDQAELRVFIVGAVSGKVVVSTPRPSFGVVRQGEPSKMSIEVRAFDASVDIGRVTAKSRKGAVNVAVRPDEDAEINGRWFVELGLPEDAPVEAVDDVIDVTTGVPGEEKIELTVVGEVVAKAK